MQITITSLSQRFGERYALSGVDVSFPAGKLTSILGPSGCGKTTLLSIVAGILAPTSGTVKFGDADVTGLPPEKRNLGFVFQNYALYPHLTVAQNIGYPLRFVRGMSAKERQRRVTELAEMVRVDELLQHRPGELSGGQQQRVAIARALAKRPSVVLMDEPLSNLDARLKHEMRVEIRRIQHESGVTMVLVTHDQEDALAVSDQVVVMRGGKIEQVSSPIDTVADPRTLFVADFIGEPPPSQLPVMVNEHGLVSLANTGTPLPCTAPGGLRPQAYAATLAVHSGAVSFGAAAETPHSALALVTNRTATSSGYVYKLALDASHTLTARAPGDLRFELGSAVEYRIDSDHAFYFDPESGVRLA